MRSIPIPSALLIFAAGVVITLVIQRRSRPQYADGYLDAIHHMTARRAARSAAADPH